MAKLSMTALADADLVAGIALTAADGTWTRRGHGGRENDLDRSRESYQLLETGRP
jgi:hypothetical protein